MAQILILEEDKRHFQLIKQCVEAKGHKSFWTSRTTEALELLQKFAFDLIVSGVSLESGDVFEFLRAVRNDAKLSHVPLVFCCAEKDRTERFASDVIKTAGTTLGARKYILLPDFNASTQLWEELQECLPENGPKTDVLGGPVTSYSIGAFSWTQTMEKVS